MFFIVLYEMYQNFNIKNQINQINENQKVLLRQTSNGQDISKASNATGKARKMQILQFENLKNIHYILELNNIPYFIEAGTLLGAERHQGWIPWDDDTDIGVMYPDCEKADKLMEEYNIKRTKVNQIDISCNFFIDETKKQEIIRVHKIMKVLGRFRKIPLLKKVSSGFFNYFVKKYTVKKSNLVAAHHYLDGRLGDPYFENGLYENTILPLKKIPFEGFQFWAPADSDKFLMNVYGNWDEVSSNFSIFDHNYGVHEKNTTYHRYTNKELDNMINEAKNLGKRLQKELLNRK